MRARLPTGKQVADSITWARLALAGGLIGLGLIRGRGGVDLVVWAMLVDWTGDCLDGVIARRSRVRAHTWIGDHDLAVDMIVSIGLLGYLLLAGLLDFRLASVYLVGWALLFWRWRVPPALGMLFQAPIYGWFIISALVLEPAAGGGLIAWILAAIAITWPRFPKAVVPGFLRGMRALTQRPPHESGSTQLPRTH
jgi:hypothetical protein